MDSTNTRTFRYKVLRAEVTLKVALRLDALVVAALVEQQIALQRKRFAALVARVRPLAGVAATASEWAHRNRKND